MSIELQTKPMPASTCWWPIAAASQCLADFCGDTHAVGSFEAAALLWQRLRWWGATTGLARLRAARFANFEQPAYFRKWTSDWRVLEQVLQQEGYGRLAPTGDVRTIVDCGANIGCTSLYLLTKYPDARVVAIEPDAENYAVCQRNLRRFGDRALCINAGVWSHATSMRVERHGYRDGRAWAFQVRPCTHGESADFTAITIDDAMRQAGFDRIDLLKIDVERSELELFAEPARYQNWLNLTRNLAIELHDPECEQVFARAVAADDWHIERQGELTVCRRIG